MAKRIGASDILTTSLKLAQKRVRKDLTSLINISTIRTPSLRIYPKNSNLIITKGDTLEGLKILDGRLVLGSQSLDVGKNGDPWSVAAPSPAYAKRLHGFSWLNHLTALSVSKPHLTKNPNIANQTQKKAKWLLDRWINIYGKGNPFIWREDILVERIYSWLSTWHILFAANETKNNQAARIREANLYQQITRLRKFYKYTQDGIIRLKAACCLVMAAACFDGRQDTHLDKALDQMDAELYLQILTDGGHISRSPEAVATALEILIITETLLVDNGVKSSRELRRAIDRLTPMLGFFMQGSLIPSSGHLFSFHGGGISRPKYIKALLKEAGIKPKNFSYAPHSKYQRLERNQTILLFDVGDCPPPPFDLEAHLAPLAFELSTATGPLIVNCGWNSNQPDKWRQLVRKTPAHSTLILDNQDCGQLLTDWRKKLFGPAILKNAAPVSYKRQENETGVWIEASHDGYIERYGLRHTRQVYMDLSGNDIRGEDILSVPAGYVPIRHDQISFAIRFHLHPSLKTTLARDQKSALLLQPGKKGWHFRTDAGQLSLEKSVYLAEGSKPQRCEQLVIYGKAYGDSDGRARTNRVRWTLKRLGVME